MFVEFRVSGVGSGVEGSRLLTLLSLSVVYNGASDRTSLHSARPVSASASLYIHMISGKVKVVIAESYP